MWTLMTKAAIVCACACNPGLKSVEWGERTSGFTSEKTCRAAARELGYTSTQQFRCIKK